MRIAVLCATHRGHRFLERLTELLPDGEFLVFTFPEEPEEPPFVAAIQELTESRGGEFHVARRVDAEPWRAVWENAALDLMFVVSWRYMLRPEVYCRPPLGTFVFHDSLLPRYRGFSPTVWSIVNGDDHTGVTLFQISEHWDAGDVVGQRRIPIGPDETIGEVMERVTEGYLSLLEDHLGALLNNTAPRVPQDHSLASYTCKRLPEDNEIDWAGSTASIYNLIRAVTHPYPGAFTRLSNRILRVWSARWPDPPKLYSGRIPGRVVEVRNGEGSVVLTGDGALLLSRVQLDGDEPACASDVLNRLSLTLGR